MMGMQPQIILLKEGTDTSQGKAQLISNINACMAVVDTVRTTLGPRGMDKLIHDSKVCKLHVDFWAALSPQAHFITEAV
jgi:T-complex protein 1 subunit eta